jgi:hypothetical protein
MPSNLDFYPFTGVVLILLALLFYRVWQGGRSAPAGLKLPRRKPEPKLFGGLTRKPDCEACAQQIQSQPHVLGAPPPRMILTRGRRRQVDTTSHFCPQATCSEHGRVGFGNIRANGHPNGRRWRQLVCLGGHGYVLETHGTPLHGKQVDPDTLVWALAALAAGLGIRAVARIFEVNANTVLGWLVAAAEHLEAFSR